MNISQEFLKRHGMWAEDLDVTAEAEKMCREMKMGLRGEDCSLPMIPTYLRDGGSIPVGSTAAVIDAGGTNFRSALVSFTEDGYKIQGLSVKKMPGAGSRADWDEFISFAADSIMPFMGETELIGFCFSYSADITPQIDGRVRSIDKEVVIENSAGKLVGDSLKRELERRNIFNKRIVVINDTAAVLLGGAAVLNEEDCGGYIAQVSGTGTNTCCAVPLADIKKLGLSGEGSMIINTESGMYDGLPMGEFDRLLDDRSNSPGLKHFEKMTAGVYIGPLCSLMIRKAAEEGEISERSADCLLALPVIDGAVADSWACGEGLEAADAEDREFIRDICKLMFRRSAIFMCIDLTALMLLTGRGRDKKRPVFICAEGSLVRKSRIYRPALEEFLKERTEKELGLYSRLIPVDESTLPGSAAAAILN